MNVGKPQKNAVVTLLLAPDGFLLTLSAQLALRDYLLQAEQLSSFAYRATLVDGTTPDARYSVNPSFT